MPSLSEIRFDVLRKVKGQLVSDDERLEFYYLDRLIHNKRNFLIREEARRGLGFSVDYLQIVDCLSVKCDEIACAGVPSGVRYHYVDLPSGCNDRVNYLGTTDGLTQFQWKSVSGFVHAMPGLFGRSVPCYTIVENRALLKFFPKNVDTLRLIAALDNPMEKYDGETCLLDHENDPYPVPVAQISRLVNLVLMDLLATQNIQPDATNDAADETNPARVDPRPLQPPAEL